MALGEATKTVPFVMDGRKTYRFTVRWGEERDTDDADGAVTATSAARPTPRRHPRAAAGLHRRPSPRCRRAIRPSRWTASGPMTSPATARSWTCSPAGRYPPASTWLTIPDRRPRAYSAAECGKGTYVRSLARDIGRALGCLGHICGAAARRVGSFTEADGENDMSSLEQRDRAAMP